MKKFSISVFILIISFFATHVYAQKFMSQEEYNALKDSLSRLESDISKMNNEFKTTRDELRLTNNDIDFYLRKGYWSIEGTGREATGYLKKKSKTYYYNIKHTTLFGYDIVNKEMANVISKDIYGEHLEYNNIKAIFNDYIKENFKNTDRGGNKKKLGRILCSQSFNREGNVYLCIYIDYKDDYLGIDRKHGLIYDIKNKSILKPHDVLTSNAIQHFGFKNNGENVSLKLTKDSLILTDYGQAPAKAVGLILKDNKQFYTDRFISLLKEADELPQKIAYIRKQNSLVSQKLKDQKLLKETLSLAKVIEIDGEVLKAKVVMAQGVEEEKVFDVVEQMPEFTGGPQALFNWLSANVKYPASAEENGVQGRVIVTFVVEIDGSITDVHVVKSVDPALDKEAARVVKSMPRWKPGKHNGSRVRVKYTMPVTFRLQ